MGLLPLLYEVSGRSWSIVDRAIPKTSAHKVPAPHEDPFYAPSEELEPHAPGTLLSYRPINVSALGLPLSMRAWHLHYRTTDTKGRPVSAVTTLMLPKRKPALDGPRPLLSYQCAIDAIGAKSDPSYTLRRGNQKELALMAPALRRGWAVVTSDYHGPRKAYGAGLMAARGVLDGIRAAVNFEPGELGPDAPVGMWGYSGGGQATGWAAEQHPVYAPELNIVGSAAGGMPGDLVDVFRALDGSMIAGLLIGTSIGVSREFPEMDIEAILNDEGRRMFGRLQEASVEELGTAYPFGRLRRLTTVDPLTVPAILNVLGQNALGKGTPSAPMYVYQAVLDRAVPVTGTDGVVRAWADRGATILYHRRRLAGHISLAGTGVPQVLRYLGDRFAGLPAPRNVAPSAEVAEEAAA